MPQEGTTMPRAKKTVRSTAAKRIRLLIATRKGLWTLTSDLARNAWKIAGPLFHGHIVHHAIGDPRDARTCDRRHGRHLRRMRAASPLPSMPCRRRWSEKWLGRGARFARPRAPSLNPGARRPPDGRC